MNIEWVFNIFSFEIIKLIDSGEKVSIEKVKSLIDEGELLNWLDKETSFNKQSIFRGEAIMSAEEQEKLFYKELFEINSGDSKIKNSGLCLLLFYSNWIQQQN